MFHKTIKSLIQKRTISTLSLGITGSIIGSASIFLIARFKIAKPNQYLIRTGLGISDIRVSKTGFQWPLQRFDFLDMQPKTYTFDLKAMSFEKIDFTLPAVFTIGPKNDPESLVKYARLVASKNISNDDDTVYNHTVSHIDSIILGILEGEVRTLSSTMSIEDIFNNRQTFKSTIITNVQEELNQLGLLIYNANIKELEDGKESNYFHNMRQKKISEAENKAKVDIAEASKVGNIGHKERETDTRQRNAQLEANTVEQENINNQNIEKSKAELEVVKADAFRKAELARIEADNATKIRNTELQKELEIKRIGLETEKQRAKEYTTAQVEAEINVVTAQGHAEAKKKDADALLYTKQREADGILALYNAQSQGIDNLIKSFNGDHKSLIQYLMLNTGTYKDLAETNAKAIQGLNPKITIWNTSTDKNNYTDNIANIMKLIPPMVSTIHDQTGISIGEPIIKQCPN